MLRIYWQRYCWSSQVGIWVLCSCSDTYGVSGTYSYWIPYSALIQVTKQPRCSFETNRCFHRSFDNFVRTVGKNYFFVIWQIYESRHVSAEYKLAKMLRLDDSAIARQLLANSPDVQQEEPCARHLTICGNSQMMTLHNEICEIFV